MRRGFLIFALLLTPTLAHAHALGVQAKMKDGKVTVEVYYDEGSPAGKAKVKLLNGKDEIATAVTDAEGRCTFDAPAAGKYEIHADAGGGHNAKTTLTILETNGAPTTVSDGPSREEFTSTPWLKIGIGVSVIGAMCVAFLLASMMRKNGRVEPEKDH
jgi:hypothetical protein